MSKETKTELLLWLMLVIIPMLIMTLCVYVGFDPFHARLMKPEGVE